jgi:hypothetical protein
MLLEPVNSKTGMEAEICEEKKENRGNYPCRIGDCP